MKSFRGKKLFYGSDNAALVTHIDVNIGSLFAKYVVDKAHFTIRYQVYVVIAIETNAHIIIHVPASHTLDHLHLCKQFTGYNRHFNACMQFLNKLRYVNGFTTVNNLKI